MSTADSEQLTGTDIDAQADDMALLRRYVDLGSQDAFNQLVGRHLSWVHATCRKGLRDRHMAEDAAQAVFIILARRAASIPPQTRLSGWLFNTARFVIKDAKKQETRYRRRENVAREMSAVRLTPVREPVDASTQAVLDDALATLTERDRLALLMHFYEGLSLQEMADSLGITKDGAKKRVARALSRLRSRMGRNGKAVATAAALAVLLRSRAAEAAPLGMAQTVASSATVPGVATSVAKWMAQRAMSTSAGASRRLLRALVALEMVTVATMVTTWALPSRRLAVTSAVGTSVTNVEPAAPQPPASAKPTPANRTVLAAAPEPVAPYRSGAFDPEPRIEPLPPFADEPKPMAQAGTPGGGGSGWVASSGSAVGTSSVVVGGGYGRVAVAQAPLPLPPTGSRFVPQVAPSVASSSSGSSASSSSADAGRTRTVAIADAPTEPTTPKPPSSKPEPAKYRPGREPSETVATGKMPMPWPESAPKPVPAPSVHEPSPPPVVVELPPPFVPALPDTKVRPARFDGYAKGDGDRGKRIVALAMKDDGDQGRHRHDGRGREHEFGFEQGVRRVRREFVEETATRVAGSVRKHSSAAQKVAAVKTTDTTSLAEDDSLLICPPLRRDASADFSSDVALSTTVATPYAQVRGERRIMAYEATASAAAEYAFALPALTAQSVPEPTGLVSLTLAGAWSLLSRRRRRRG